MRARCFVAIAVTILTAVAASAQAPAVGWQLPPTETPQSPPVAVAYGPGDAPEEKFWIRGDYVVWAATTHSGLQAARELSSNPLFNNLLELTGTSQTDLISAAFQNRIGYRLNVGKWLEPDQSVGVEATGFYYYRQAVNVPLTSADAARGLGPLAGAIGLPAVAAGGGGTVVVPITSPLVNGVVNFELNNLLVYGVQAAGRARLAGSDNSRLDGLLGISRYEVEGTIGINAAAVGRGAPLLANSIVATNESIFAESVYTGPTIALDYEAFFGHFDFGVRPAVTIAYLQTVVDRKVSAQANLPGFGPTVLTGGTYLPVGGLQELRRSGWTCVPELALRLGCSLGDHVRIVAGGSVMIFPDASRPEGQLLFGLPADRLLPDVGGIPRIGQLVVPTYDTVIVFTASIGLEFRF